MLQNRKQGSYFHRFKHNNVKQSTHTYTHKCDSTCFGAPQESIKGQQSGVSFVQSSHVLCACSADCVCVTLHTALITSQASSSVVIFIFKPCQKNSTRLRWKCPLTHKGWFTACSTFIICYKLCTVHSFLDKYSILFLPLWNWHHNKMFQCFQFQHFYPYYMTMTYHECSGKV